MLAWFVLAVCVLLAVALAGRWFATADPKIMARVLKRGVLTILVCVIVFLAVTGRLAFVIPLVAGAVWWLIRNNLKSILFRGAQQAFRAGTAGASGGGSQSDVKTDYLHMKLDHESGEISGQILRGRFKGAELTSLSTAEVIDLLRECQSADPKSANLLAAYLDKTAGPDWRDTWSHDQNGSAGAGNGGEGPMTRDEALEVLGLSGNPTAEEIKAAHHRLMQKMHPDMGGSTWLATKINAARDLLLNS
jgi:hypothetical protein